MSDFVMFSAVGLVYERDKNGKLIGVKDTIRTNGVVRNTEEIQGKIFRQCPELLPCDTLRVHTIPLN